ncbi:CAF17-like 4Fe-4S cluster assembly/insertion protein YgfZ [Neoroseomonas soli]|uniref:Folate-binding protein YgfZ n=1 Tax=Neoroseomonas soli TaxID=1081025 RepID=A0A9X9WYQ8_9PROT|nr:folate-binding protein YgfZ [Neoroseomonas soli]MBR0672287.1 folate-binding protein YgfZ [Neoroseomonas soli]
MSLAYLPDRGVLEVAGPDRAAFLQGLVSNDVTGIAPGQAVWAALLTPQGKWLADFFVIPAGDALLLDAERAQVPGLVQRLTRFRLRSKVTLRDASEDWHVHAAWGGAPPAEGLVIPDPRLPEAGWRVLDPAPLASDASAEDYDLHRLALGLPDGSKDMESEKSVLLEAGFDELNGVSWSKGCYMGQELTARTRYRGLVKRRLVPVAVDGPLPVRGTILAGPDGAEAGEMRSGRDGLGLALVRLNAFDRAPFRAGEAMLTPRIPAWMRLPAREEA